MAPSLLIIDSINEEWGKQNSLETVKYFTNGVFDASNDDDDDDSGNDNNDDVGDDGNYDDRGTGG